MFMLSLISIRISRWWKVRWTLGAGFHVEILRLGVVTVVGCGVRASRGRTSRALPWWKSFCLRNILGIFHPRNHLGTRQNPDIAQILGILEKLLGSVHVVTWRAPIEIRRVHMHSERSSACIVVVVEVSHQNIIPHRFIAVRIAGVHHRTTSSVVFVHKIDVWNLPEAGVGHFWAWLLSGRANLSWLVIQGVGVHRATPTKLNISRPGQVVSKFADV